MNMKHHPSEPETQTKLNNMSHSTTPSRFRPNSKTRPSPSQKQESVSPDVKTNGITTKTRRSLVLNRPKFSDDALGSQKLDEVKVLGRSVNRPVVEQFARPKKAAFYRRLVGDAEKKLADDLVAAQAKIVALSSREQGEPTGEYQSPKFKDIQKLIANKLEHSIVKKGAHLLAIKADIETKGDFIESLIQKVLAAAYTDIEDADEQAVLKHFKWPEKKADAMREAAVEYRELKLLENIEVCDVNLTLLTCLSSISSARSERSIQRLIKLRNSVMRSYQDCKIPVDWMLDSGIVSKIKQASMKLAQMYMKRVTMEFESVRNSDRESTQEALLLQGVHFAYRAHQFAGGLDSETLCAFEEIRQRVPGHLGGSRQLLAGIPS
ncbi:hypothetical protein Patl1_24720 [Pistacia atlantica]|uniref:Uncharacterized protein n=1 Tax=Pistacia atlantica TaxID=434234 RepID=A0ACC1AZD2_9ROSI|nr:hypothetical protein Patl1_24720 [Pistacia atlantica]